MSPKIQPLILIKSVDDNLIEVKVLALFLWFGEEGQTLIFDINKGVLLEKVRVWVILFNHDELLLNQDQNYSLLKKHPHSPLSTL